MILEAESMCCCSREAGEGGMKSTVEGGSGLVVYIISDGCAPPTSILFSSSAIHCVCVLLYFVEKWFGKNQQQIETNRKCITPLFNVILFKAENLFPLFQNKKEGGGRSERV
jgi:hypothetical protein